MNTGDIIITDTRIRLFVGFIKYIQRFTIQIWINFNRTSFISFNLDRIIIAAYRLFFSASIIWIGSLSDSISSMSESPWEWILWLWFYICLYDILFSYNSFNKVVGWTCRTPGILICVLVIWILVCVHIIWLQRRSLKTTRYHLRLSFSFQAHICLCFFLYVWFIIISLYESLLILNIYSLNISILWIFHWIVILYIFRTIFIQINLAVFDQIIYLEYFSVRLSVFLFAVEIIFIWNYLHFWNLILICYRFIIKLLNLINIFPSEILYHSWTWYIGIISRGNSYNILSIFYHIFSYRLVLIQISSIYCVV